jgi:anti-anti-sigma factor
MQITSTPTRPGSDQITRVTIKDGIHNVRIAMHDLRAHDMNRFRKELAAMYEPGSPLLIVMSFKRLRVLSSACIGMLIEFSDALSPVGGALVLYDVPKDISKALKKLGLHKQLPIAKNADHARKLVSTNIKPVSPVIRDSAA